MVSISSTTARHLLFTALVNRNYFPVEIIASIAETNPALTRVGATLDWNDGTPLVVFPPGNPISINVTRNLPIGNYFITLTAFNYAQPAPQTTSIHFSVEIQPQQIVPVSQSYLFGPILPLDNEFPNAAQWSFNLSNNLTVLKSSVKMLLLTTKGERIMLPSYGTLLRRIIFDPSGNSVSATIQQEITDALSQFEPRVTLSSFEVQRADPGGRSYLVNATFLSKISQAVFSLALPFSQ